MAPKMKVGELKKLLAERWNYPPEKKPPKTRFIACGKSINYGIPKSYTPCWKSPMPASENVKYGPCWEYPPERYKRFPLPPPCRGTTIPTNELVPHFDHCKTLYTRGDFRLEECVHQQILYIEKLFKDLEVQFAEAKTLQIDLCKKMRYQAIRRRLLLGSSCGIKIYPEYLSQMAENRALCDFQKDLKAVNQSNTELADAVLEVRNALPELRQRLDKLDRSVSSPFVESLDTVLQTIQDLYDYFFELIRKYKTWAELIDAAQEHSVDDYLALLRTKQDFESFKRSGTEHCTCFRCRNNNPLEPYIPCWCQGCNTRKSVDLLAIKEPSKFQPPAPQLDSSDSDRVEQHSYTSIYQDELEKLKDDSN